MRVGFPHSEIPGSKLVCQLPVAYRRLQRPSSPVIAKASTTCTCSLDPITLSPRADTRSLRVTGELVFAALEILMRSSARYNLTHPDSSFAARKHNARFATNRDLYFFRIVKERYSRSTHGVECSALRKPSAINIELWS